MRREWRVGKKVLGAGAIGFALAGGCAARPPQVPGWSCRCRAAGQGCVQQAEPRRTRPTRRHRAEAAVGRAEQAMQRVETVMQSSRAE